VTGGRGDGGPAEAVSPAKQWSQRAPRQAGAAAATPRAYVHTQHTQSAPLWQAPHEPHKLDWDTIDPEDGGRIKS
jgi:hypothetical protein